MIILHVILVGFILYGISNCFAKTGPGECATTTLPSLYLGGYCFVLHTTPATFHNTVCDDFEGGHLGVIPPTKIRTVLWQFAIDNGLPIVYNGLQQAWISVRKVDSVWYWLLPDGRNWTGPVNWIFYISPYFDGGNYATLTAGGVNDLGPSFTFGYICQYEGTTGEFRGQSGKQAMGGAFGPEIHVEDSLKCAAKYCASTPVCMSFSFNHESNLCWLNMLDDTHPEIALQQNIRKTRRSQGTIMNMRKLGKFTL